MVSFRKPKEEVLEKPKVSEGVKTCDCGEPIATELGQTSVCKKHIRAS